MFIRWKKRFTHSKKWYRRYRQEQVDGKWKTIPLTDDEKPCLLSVYLVKSVRIDGKPRQQATFLASIPRKNIVHPYQRFYFWQHVQKRIEPFLPDLSEEQQQAIKAKLLEVVPDVTKEQLQAVDEELARHTAELKALLGRKA